MRSLSRPSLRHPLSQLGDGTKQSGGASPIDRECGGNSEASIRDRRTPLRAPAEAQYTCEPTRTVLHGSFHVLRRCENRAATVETRKKRWSANLISTQYMHRTMHVRPVRPYSCRGGIDDATDHAKSLKFFCEALEGVAACRCTALAQVPASITVAAGASSAAFQVSTTPTRRTRNVSISATGGGKTARATLTVTR